MNEKTKDDSAATAELPAVVYPLMKPIMSYGEKLTHIKMRAPNGEDLILVGNPVIFSPHLDPPRIEHDQRKVLDMVARISDPKIPTSSLIKMDPQDIVGIAWAISPFFTPAR